MDSILSMFQYSVNKVIFKRYRSIIFADLIADSFSYVSLEDGEFVLQPKEAERASTYMSFLAESPLTHDDDRELLRTYSNIEHVKDQVLKGSFKPFYLTYRRKISFDDTRYSLTYINAVPIGDEKHLYLILFARDITTEFDLLKRDVIGKLNKEDVLNNGRRAVLIVDDDEFSREMLHDMLEEDFNIYEAADGKEALNMLEDIYNEVSVIISDINMPNVNGFEMLEKINADPLFSSIPVIAVTSDNEEERCLQLGAADFVNKPYNRAVLLSRINSIVRLRESSSALSEIEYVSKSNIYTRQAFIHHYKNALSKHSEIDWSLIVYNINEYRKNYEALGFDDYGNCALAIGAIINGINGYHLLVGKNNENEFVIMTDMKTNDFIEQLTLALNADELPLLGKIGIYEHLDKKEGAYEAINNAKEAIDSIYDLYDVHYHIYDEKLRLRKSKILLIESKMEEALSNDQFVVHYQPKHDAKTGELVGAEALIRWLSPEYGFMSPADFIPLFEKNGFIAKVDEYVWDRTCFNIRKWLDKGIDVVPISINTSRNDFSRKDFLARRMEPLKENELDPKYLHMEVTESLFSEDVEELSEILKTCKDAGFEIEMDDFGTGYSSLNILTTLPLDVLKLDMSFAKHFDDKRRHQVFEICVRLAKRLNLKTVSEGVETLELAKRIADMGVDIIQGYCYSKALSEKEFEAYMISHKRGSSK